MRARRRARRDDQIRPLPQHDRRDLQRHQHQPELRRDVRITVEYDDRTWFGDRGYVDDSKAPSYTVIADGDGNKACV